MNLSRERIDSIRRKAQREALLAPGEVADLIGHNDHLTQLCETRARLLISAETEIERLRAENEKVQTEAKRQEGGLKEMLRRQNKRICALEGRRHD